MKSRGAVMFLFVLFACTGLVFAGVQNSNVDAVRIDPANVQPIIPSIEALWDLQDSIDCQAKTGALGNAGAEFDGTYYYSTRWASNLIHQYDINKNLIKQFSVPGVTGLRDLAWDGTYMYGGNAGFTVYEMDFDAELLISTFPSTKAVRHISYDAGADGFWTGTWGDDPTLHSRAGVASTVLVTPHTGQYGTAYDDWSAGGPYLYVFDQGLGAGTAQLIHQYDLNTLLATGVTHDVAADFPTTAGIAGGLWTSEGVVSGTATIGGLLQGVPDVIFAYELVELGGGLPAEVCDALSTGPLKMKCQANGTINLRKRMIGFTGYGGTEVKVLVDGTDSYTFTIEDAPNGAGSAIEGQMAGSYAPGDHTVSIPDCGIEQVVNCQAPDAMDLTEDSDLLGVPASTELMGNYPNPFNPSTTISYALSADSYVTLKVYNTLGQEVATLVDGFQTAGYLTATWNGRNDFGSTVSSGIYVYRLTAGDVVQTAKMMFMK